MGVAVDESGQNQRSLGIDRLRDKILGLKFIAWTYRDDRVVFHNNGSVVINGSRSIHGHNRSAADDKVGFFFLRLR